MSQSHRFRQWLRQLEPRVLASLDRPGLRRLRPWLAKHNVLRFNRESLARGLGLGMLCALIPGPFQLLASLGLCVWLRGNAVAAALATLFTNPLTIVPLYWAAFQIGAAILPGQHPMPPLLAPQDSLSDWALGLGEWIGTLGWPLLVGLPVLATVLAAQAYVMVHILFLTPVIRRARRKARHGAPHQGGATP